MVGLRSQDATRCESLCELKSAAQSSFPGGSILVRRSAGREPHEYYEVRNSVTRDKQDGTTRAIDESVSGHEDAASRSWAE